jgi:hypothetical protein
MFIGLHVKYRVSCRILMKLPFFQQTFEKYLGIKFYENPSSGNRVVPCGRADRQTDVTKLIVAAPEIVLLLMAFCVFVCFVLVSGQTGTLVQYNIQFLLF